jgi:deferrochelatase/peroxidase EfeB
VTEHDPRPDASGVSRRRLFQGAGAGAVAGLAGGLAGGFAGGRASADDGGPGGASGADSVDLTQRHEFYTGARQVGVETPQQRHCVLMTFDLTASTAQELQVLLARWSAGIATMMAGRPVGAVQPSRVDGVADDTGEAFDLEPASLTVTLGLGPGVFDDRFGLAGKRPKNLRPLPALPSDQLKPALTGGDLCLQACADDPQVAYHAIRDLARIARGTANTRWTVLGFGRASAGRGQTTPRNLMGFKDGTRNVKSRSQVDEHVWLGADDDVAWMRGGTYQVVRKIEMDIEIWDSATITTQQQVFGRTKEQGAPLSGGTEFTTPDFTKTGAHAIAPTAHVALAAPENNDGTRILRRGYNFTDGINDVGQLDAGLLFIAFMKDPAQFVKLQTRLGSSDQLNEYISHIGSGVFAVPPAPRKGRFIGQELFA